MGKFWLKGPDLESHGTANTGFTACAAWLDIARMYTSPRTLFSKPSCLQLGCRFLGRRCDGVVGILRLAS